MTAEDFEPGHIVRRHGSPQLMTVERVAYNGSRFTADCVWYVELEIGAFSEVKRHTFDFADLERVRL
jgi:hypothetical protein